MKNSKIKSYMPIFGLIIVITLFAVLTGGKTLQPKNLRLVTEQAITVIISAAGVVFVMTMGSLNFSQGSLLAVCCYCAAWVSNINVPLAFVAAIAAGCAIGVVNGVLHGCLKVPSFIATIGTMLILRGLVIFLTTNYMPPIPYIIYGMDNLSVKLIVVVILLISGFLVFNYTKLGREVKAIGAGETAAHFSGIKVTKVKVTTFAIAGAMAGVGGFFSLLRTGVVTASTGNLLETDVMIALVLGGLSVSGGSKSKYSAVLIGGLLLAFLENGLVQLGVDITTQQLIKGIVFIITIILTTDRSRDTVSK